MGNKGVYTYEYERPAMSCDCVLLSKEASEYQVLLIQRGKEPYKNYWAFPGGFLEMNETLEQCAKRELQEETGIVVSEISFVCMVDKIDRDPRGRVISGIYTAMIDKNSVIAKADDDAKALKWFNISELPNLAFDHEALILKVFRFWNISVRFLKIKNSIK